MRCLFAVSLVLWWSSRPSAANPPVGNPPPPQTPQTRASPVVSCKDANDRAVDWYILYKAPKLAGRTGQQFVYVDKDGRTFISSIKRVLANTLQPMLRSVRDMPATFGFISYSDQPPGCLGDKKYGHSKGVVMGDSGTGTALWLPHSTPKFPLSRNPQRFWPLSGNIRGQTFMCVSLVYNDLNAIGTHLQHIRALPFDHDLPGNFPEQLRKVVDKAHSKSHWISLSKAGKVQNLRTRIDQTQLNQGALREGAELKLIAKRNYRGEDGVDEKVGDLYRQLVAQLDTGGVYAQSWRCGADYKYDTDVINIKKIKTDVEWETEVDHSKWAVTKSANVHWTCIADMNRCSGHSRRPGGALCINSVRAHGFFKEFIKKTETATSSSSSGSATDSTDVCVDYSTCSTGAMSNAGGGIEPMDVDDDE